MFTFKWDGSYNTAHEFLQRLPRSYERERERAMRHFGVNTLVALQQKIAAGQTGVALSPTYLAWKQKLGLQPGKLIRTRSYYYLLELERTETGFTIVPTGVEPAIENEFKRVVNPNPQSYEDVAVWLEYGTKKMPARPHWRPIAAEARARFPGVMREVIEAAFARARQGTYGGSPTGYSARVSPYGK